MYMYRFDHQHLRIPLKYFSFVFSIAEVKFITKGKIGTYSRHFFSLFSLQKFVELPLRLSFRKKFYGSFTQDNDVVDVVGNNGSVVTDQLVLIGHSTHSGDNTAGQQRFFKTPEVCIIGIFVLLRCEDE